MATTERGFIRRTKQREVILRVLRGTTSHPTADWVYQQVRKELPNISLGTVYRNLKTLTSMGEAMELSYGSTFSRFDGNAHPHYHFVCEACGRVYDVPMPVDERLEVVARKATGFEVRHHRLEFYGLCSACAHARPVQEEAAGAEELTGAEGFGGGAMQDHPVRVHLPHATNGHY